jgi:transcriptional regulator with XRE-family HTH domain
LKRTPNSVDVHVGARVRSRRMAVGLTQDTLAKAVGITFQQIQKYEKGANRVGASRLQAIARILEMPVSYFFADASGQLSAKLLEAQNMAAARKAPAPAETLKMIKTFMGMRDQDARRHLLGLVEALARKSEGEQSQVSQSRQNPGS